MNIKINLGRKKIKKGGRGGVREGYEKMMHLGRPSQQNRKSVFWLYTLK
jgi:hypothetical protein